MEKDERKYQSHLFMVRFWKEELGNGRFEWRGQIRHVPSGEVHYFREVSMVVTHLQAVLGDVLMNVDDKGDQLRGY